MSYDHLHTCNCSDQVFRSFYKFIIFQNFIIISSAHFHSYILLHNGINRVSQKVSAHNFYNLFQQQQRPYNYVIFQHSPRSLQYIYSSVPEASGCPLKKNVFG